MRLLVLLVRDDALGDDTSIPYKPQGSMPSSSNTEETDEETEDHVRSKSISGYSKIFLPS